MTLLAVLHNIQKWLTLDTLFTPVVYHMSTERGQIPELWEINNPEGDYLHSTTIANAHRCHDRGTSSKSFLILL